jgi:hypothetical protein
VRAGVLASVGLLGLLLLLPSRPDGFGPAALGAVPLELPALVLVLVAAPRRARPAVRGAVVVLLVATTVLKLADLATKAAFLRPFNPVLDRELPAAGLRLLAGSVGWPLALAALAAAAGALAALAWATWRATGRIAAADGPRWLGAAAVPALALVLADAGPFDLPGRAATSRLAWAHLGDARRAGADLAAFRAAAAEDPLARLAPEAILPALEGRDVLVVFVESYGRSALTNPRYAPTVTATLAEAEARLADAGLAARSAFLASPTVGGQSWLARATLVSGLRVADKGRYRALVASPRRTLLHLAQKAGWRTAAVVPAITLAWPEGGYFGYDEVLAADDLGYRGKPFNWVTMPDQFTLAALERRLLGPGPRAPVFAEVALISSHAPWTPVPELVPWDALGDGRVFDAQATAGDPPDVVWRDPERVRDQYLAALDYALRAVAGFAERRAASDPLLVVLGDHQPAAFVSGDAADPAVPVHVIGSPAALGHLDGWGWTPALVPGADAHTWPMEAFRDRFVAAFATAPDMRAAAVP